MYKGCVVLKFIEDLYFGPKALENSKKVVKDLKKGKYLPGVCLITLPTNKDNILDIMEAYMLLQPAIDTSELTVVGITYGRDEALELVRQIVDDTFSKLGTIDIKKYLGID